MQDTIIQGPEWHHARFVQGRRYRLKFSDRKVVAVATPPPAPCTLTAAASLVSPAVQSEADICGVAVADVMREGKLYGLVPCQISWGVRFRTDDGSELEIAWDDITAWNKL